MPPFNEAISKIFVINYQTTDLTVGSFALENLIKRKQKEWAANEVEKMKPDLEGMPDLTTKHQIGIHSNQF